MLHALQALHIDGIIFRDSTAESQSKQAYAIGTVDAFV
jgi:hypothetical protein